MCIYSLLLGAVQGAQHENLRVRGKVGGIRGGGQCGEKGDCLVDRGKGAENCPIQVGVGECTAQPQGWGKYLGFPSPEDVL